MQAVVPKINSPSPGAGETPTPAGAGNDSKPNTASSPNPAPPESSPPNSPPTTPPESPGPTLPPEPFWKKKLVLIAAGGVFLVILLTLVFSLLRHRHQPRQPVTLTYWGLWEPAGVVQGAIAEFEKSHPGIKINYRLSDPTDYQARLENSLARNQGPDIFRLHVTWLPVFADQLAPVPAAVEQSLDLDHNYFSVIPRSLKANGHYLALPLMIDNLALFYNQKILQAAGLKPPRTWWGLEEMAKKLTTRDPNQRIKVAGVALGTVSNVDHWSDIVGLMLYQNGVDLRQPQKSRQSLQEALTFYTIFSRRDHVWDATLPNSTLAFASERLVFYFAPSWRIFNLQDMNPKLRFATAPVPKLPKNTAGVDMATAEKSGELNEINWATFWVEGVNRHSSHQKEAWEFLQYLASKEGLQRLYQAESQIRAFGEIYPRRDLAKGLDANPLLRPFINQAETSYVWYLASATHDNGPNEAMRKYFADAINGLNQGKSEDTVIETLLQGINQVRSRYRLP